MQLKGHVQSQSDTSYPLNYVKKKEIKTILTEKRYQNF